MEALKQQMPFCTIQCVKYAFSDEFLFSIFSLVKSAIFPSRTWSLQRYV